MKLEIFPNLKREFLSLILWKLLLVTVDMKSESHGSISDCSIFHFYFFLLVCKVFLSQNHNLLQKSSKKNPKVFLLILLFLLFLYEHCYWIMKQHLSLVSLQWNLTSKSHQHLYHTDSKLAELSKHAAWSFIHIRFSQSKHGNTISMTQVHTPTLFCLLYLMKFYQFSMNFLPQISTMFDQNKFSNEGSRMKVFRGIFQFPYQKRNVFAMSIGSKSSNNYVFVSKKVFSLIIGGKSIAPSKYDPISPPSNISSYISMITQIKSTRYEDVVNVFESFNLRHALYIFFISCSNEFLHLNSSKCDNNYERG